MDITAARLWWTVACNPAAPSQQTAFVAGRAPRSKARIGLFARDRWVPAGVWAEGETLKARWDGFEGDLGSVEGRKLLGIF